MKRILLIASLFVVAFGQDVLAQPGATPPGSMPPNSAPPPPYSAPPDSAPPEYGTSPYYGPPMPPPPATLSQERVGWNLGLSLGVGSMSSSIDGGFACVGCESEPPSVGFDLHVGTMVTPRLAIQGELWGQVRPIDADSGAYVNQSMVLLALQYWLTPRFWVKGGIGYAGLSVNYNDGYEDRSDNIGEGVGVMGAVGYELVSMRTFAFDLQLKSGMGSYEENNSEEVIATTLAVGINWY